MPTYNEIAGQKLSRIEALSDGVFAIAMTLLAFNLHVPDSTNIRTDAQVWEALITISPKFLTYFLGFITLGVFYLAHTTQLAMLDQMDRHLSWLTVFFLMFVSLLPFSTSFLS